QHYLSARRLFHRTESAPGETARAAAGYQVELLVSGRKRLEKSEARGRGESGTAQFVVGTHALIENPVLFKRLGLVIVDEQHRFGGLQRKQLIGKGVSPHV